MNRAWITGLALASVGGTSVAAFAGMSASDEAIALPAGLVTASTEAPAPSSSAVSSDGVVTYQVGPAGAVTLTHTGDVLTVTTTTAGAGWTVLGASVPGSHVAVQFSDTLQVVTFSADVVGDDIAVMVENLPIATTARVVTAPPADGTVPGTAPTPTPAPATPVITQPAAGSTTPSSASTTAPSSGGDEYDHEDDDHEDEDHGDHQDDDHEEDHEEGDDD